MSRSGREALPDVQEWSGVPLGCPGVIGRPSGFMGVVRRLSWIYGSGLQALGDLREWSVGPPGCPGVFRRP